MRTFVDPLASMRLSLAGYDWLARACIALAEKVCDGKIVFVMEGGYDLPALAHGWCNIARASLGCGWHQRSLWNCAEIKYLSAKLTA